MSEHSPEPWVAGTLHPAFKATVLFNSINDSEGKQLAEIFCKEDVLCRIIACVNACIGLRTKELEDMEDEELLNAWACSKWAG